jgi:N-acetylmuramoyl-L-alanine amidase
LKAWAWPTTLLLLFLAGLLGGWAFSADRDDSGDASAPLRSPHHGRLNQEIQKLEGEVEAAEGGATSSSGVARPGASAAVTRRPLAGTTIAVDPGHNGGNATHAEEIARPVVFGAGGKTKACNTTGTETDDGRLTEAQLNFDVAEALKTDLVRLGARVVLTRSSNTGVGPCVDERAEIANRAGAVAAVSIHGDGNREAGAQGFDVIHPLPDEMIEPTMADPSLRLAENVRDAFVSAGIPPANYVGEDGLDGRDDLAGLNLVQMPAVMVEVGNMRAEAEAKKLESTRYRERIAAALAAGLRVFLEEAQL